MTKSEAIDLFILRTADQSEVKIYCLEHFNRGWTIYYETNDECSSMIIFDSEADPLTRIMQVVESSDPVSIVA